MSELSTDSVLAGLLAELLEQSRSGGTADLEGMLRRHPEHAEELRQLWATMQIAEDFGQVSAASWLGTDISSSLSIAPAGEQPRHFGDYQLLEEIGRGGMGVVYQARQISLGRTVALKVVLRGKLASSSDRQRFRAEAESAARLDHPHIVPVYEVGEIDGQPYFTMKHVVGTTLSRKLAEGPLPPREAAELLLPVCRAVAAAHRGGILHRDLKPSNILIDAEGKPHVSDFGLAKRFDVGSSDSSQGSSLSNTGAFEEPPTNPESLTSSGAILGTPSYMPPEQAAGRRGELSPASDVYSLGAILYQCLTGRPPFQAASPVDVVLLVLEQDPVPPRTLNPKADADLEMIALKCLQKPRELRYGDASKLADDLHAYLNNEPISARSTQLAQLLSQIFRETHHAGILQNWGLLWMWHSLVVLVLCLMTNWFQWRHIYIRSPYIVLWTMGFGAWAGIFWQLRRRGGPITFVERQIAHIWGASMIASSLLFWVESLLGLPVLTLSPVLALIAAVVFVVKAGILSGAFYLEAAALFATAILMAWWQGSEAAAVEWPQRPAPTFSLTLYGFISAATFFVPGLKYYLQRENGSRRG